MAGAKHTPGPWEYIPSNENHGPYVSNGWGAGDICDCYAMSNPRALSVCNGGDSQPINYQHDEADANARLIAAAPDLLEASKLALAEAESWIHDQLDGTGGLHAALQELASVRAAIAKAEGRTDA